MKGQVQCLLNIIAMYENSTDTHEQCMGCNMTILCSCIGVERRVSMARARLAYLIEHNPEAVLQAVL